MLLSIFLLISVLTHTQSSPPGSTGPDSHHKVCALHRDQYHRQCVMEEQQVLKYKEQEASLWKKFSEYYTSQIEKYLMIGLSPSLTASEIFT